MMERKPHVYGVTFYRELVGDDGKRFDSPLSTIRIRTAGREVEALALAIRQFEKQNKCEK